MLYEAAKHNILADVLCGSCLPYAQPTAVVQRALLVISSLFVFPVVASRLNGCKRAINVFLLMMKSCGPKRGFQMDE